MLPSPDLDSDIVSLLQLKSPTQRRSAQQRSTEQRPAASQANAASSYKAPPASRPASAAALPSLLVVNNTEQPANGQRIALASWLSPLTGSTHDVSELPHTVLLAVEQQVHVLSGSGVHALAMFVIVLLIACLLCACVGIAICAELRASSTSEKRPDPVANQQQKTVQKLPKRRMTEDAVTLPATVHELCPGGGFIVPQGKVITIRVPALPAVPDPLFSFTIASKDGPTLCIGQYVAGKLNPFTQTPGIEYDAYIAMTSEDQQDLGTLVIGKPPGRRTVEGHIKYGSRDSECDAGFGIVRKSSDAHHPFELFGVEPGTSLKVAVTGGQANRTMRLFTADTFEERACATAYVTGFGQAWYEVKCYGMCDMLVASLTIMGVDRITATDLFNLSSRLWS